ncbi:hypothetical protein HEB29_000981 [Streptomyces fulvorobeus]|uniref:Uncharacterized protein n=1 Tax=Streptomyces fulvorobeus TaxID=284028 RepID=A0A7Y9KV24_9ACTN|nr:hypothetical protein [Streptomyces fulvorobeus]
MDRTGGVPEKRPLVRSARPLSAAARTATRSRCPGCGSAHPPGPEPLPSGGRGPGRGGRPYQRLRRSVRTSHVACRSVRAPATQAAVPGESPGLSAHGVRGSAARGRPE